MEEGYIKKEKRKKILLLTDDIRVHSGVAQIGRQIIHNTINKYNWVQIAGAVEHPDMGKIIDMSEEIGKILPESKDPSVILYPTKGYGDMDVLRAVIARENPDAIFLITDPRYFSWLFNSEDEIRKTIPIIYLNIWDNYPAPMYNKEYYESCDLLMGISKQTVNINKLVLGNKGKNKIFKYVPHGLDNKIFRILEDNNPELLEFKKNIGLKEDNIFHLVYNSRNIRRKQVSNIIMAYKLFTDKLSPEEAKKCQLTLKTEPIFDHGTDLNAVIEYMCPPETCRVGIFYNGLSTEEMNLLYNSADGVIQLSNAEGWGLSLTEAMLTGTPFIAAVTGGMQDQMRFEDENGNWIEFNDEFPSNHYGKYKKHGEWALPVYISASTLVGSPQTPYIYDDHHNINDVVDQIMNLYKMSKKERKSIGKKGYDWATSNEAGFTSKIMANRIIEGVEELFSTWKPREKYEFLKDTDYEKRILPHKLNY
jgi:glycosyltransferase involved in cell wall biosynthesis